jgi:F-type H+-transporting ATPase subunit c
MTRFGKVFVALGIGLCALAVASPAFAQQVSDVAAKASRDAWVAIAAGIGLGVAAFGGALGQGRMAAAAMDSIGRNPGASGKIFTPMLLGLAFIEAMVIYALIIAFILSGKIGA